ncbi:hypothetical protein GH714_038341 [Hevea brasiliensis]|uniref:Uncharacterized protein n=1 Tax=Hevea brasiliensis TaxID=3981 RepID=A0A6A6L7Q6_HEVBR|nr:hypothetical protein GH714_038341 [Hevea brasiliensis]
MISDKEDSARCIGEMEKGINASSKRFEMREKRLEKNRGNETMAEMKVVAAYLLAVLGGNTSPSAEHIKDILISVGAYTDDDRIKFLLSEVDGKDITELIAAGREQLASVPSGCGVAVAAAAPGSGGGAAAAPAAAEAKKEEKMEEKEESDEDMGFSLFD